MRYALVLLAAGLCAGSGIGCVADASEPGVAAPSWYSASLDGTLVPRSGSEMLSDPNVYAGNRPIRWWFRPSPDAGTARSIGPHENPHEPGAIPSGNGEGSTAMGNMGSQGAGPVDWPRP